MSLFDRMFPPAAAPESPPGTVDGASNYGTPASEVPVPTPGSLLMAIASMPVDPTPALVTQRVKQQLHAAKQDVTTYAQAASVEKRSYLSIGVYVVFRLMNGPPRLIQ